MFKNSKGFTITELLVVLSIISIMLGLSVAGYRSFQNKNEIDNVRIIVVQSLRRAQALSQSGVNDSDWGVYVQNESVTLFKGDSFSTRDNEYDEVISISKKIIPQQNYEIVFSKFTGSPQYIGEIVLLGKDSNAELSINSKGLVTY